MLLFLHDSWCVSTCLWLWHMHPWLANWDSSLAPPVHLWWWILATKLNHIGWRDNQPRSCIHIWLMWGQIALEADYWALLALAVNRWQWALLAGCLIYRHTLTMLIQMVLSGVLRGLRQRLWHRAQQWWRITDSVGSIDRHLLAINWRGHALRCSGGHRSWNNKRALRAT